MVEREQLVVVGLVAGLVVLSAVLTPAAVFNAGTPTNGNADANATATPTPQAGEVYTASDASESPDSVGTLHTVPTSHIDGLQELDSQQAPDPPKDVAASAGSQTMRVDTTTIDGEPALVLSDDDAHEGRWVSVPTDWLQAVHGSVPETVTIRHESGDRYSEAVRVRDDSAAFYVREFSSNAVTFSGEISIQGSAVSNGTTFEYELGDIDSATDPQISITGATATDWDNVSVTQQSDGSTISLAIAGNAPPTGPSAAGEPTVTFGGNGFVRDDSFTTTSSGLFSLGVDGNVDPTDASLTVGYDNPRRAAGFYVDANDNLRAALNGTSDTGVDALRVGGSGDVDGDGRPEVVYIATDGTLSYLNLDGGAVDIGVSAQDVAGLGDMDGDGDVDIAYQDTVSELSYTDAQGNSQTLVTGSTSRTLAGIGDFDGDGTGDVVFLIDDAVKYVDDSGTVSTAVSPASSLGPIGQPADYDGDSAVEVPVWDIGNVELELADSTGIEATIDTPGTGPTDLGGAGDVDDDGAIEFLFAESGGGQVLAYEADGSIAYTSEYADDVGAITPPPADTATVSVDVDDDGTTDVSETVTNGNSVTVTVTSLTHDGGQADIDISAPETEATLSWTERKAAIDPAIDVDGDGVNETAYSGVLYPGETATVELAALTTSTDSVTVHTAGGVVNATVAIRERTQTDATVVGVNGVTTSATGQLADGETVTRSLSNSTLQTGTNTVLVEVGDGSLSSDAPDPRVDIDYVHDSTDRKTVTVTEEQLTVRYNASHTFASERSEAWLNTTFKRDVLALRDAEVRINGSSWQSVSESNYHLDGSDLAVDLDAAYGGPIPGGTTVDVRINGSRGNAIDGEIEVVNATAPGEELSSTIRVVSAGPNFRIAMTNKTVHYPTAASYDADAYWVVDQSGQRLHLPAAQADDQVTITRLPVTVDPQTNDVHVAVADDSVTEPALEVSSGQTTGDEVAFTFENATDGEAYVLWSVTNAVGRDSGTASSPLTLIDDDSGEVLEFRLDDGTLAGGGGGSAGGGGGGPIVVEAGPFSQVDADLTPAFVILAAVLAFIALLWVGRQTDLIDTGDRGDTVVESARTTANALLANEAVVGGMLVAGAVAIWQFGVIPPETATVAVLAAIPVAAYLVLRQFGEARIEFVAASSAVALVLGTEVIAPGTLGSALDALVGGVVAGLDPVVPLLGIGTVAAAIYYLRQRQTEASTPDEVNRIVISDDGGQSDD